MPKGIMKPAYNGRYSKIPELHWICEICGKEFIEFQAWSLCKEHETDCKIKHGIFPR